MTDPIRDEWYPVALVSQLHHAPRDTQLLGEPIRVTLQDGQPLVTASGRTLPSQARYGHVWTSLGTPARPLFDIPEADQPGRRLVDVGLVRVKCSPLRAV